MAERTNLANIGRLKREFLNGLSVIFCRWTPLLLEESELTTMFPLGFFIQLHPTVPLIFQALIQLKGTLKFLRSLSSAVCRGLRTSQWKVSRHLPGLNVVAVV